MQVVTEFIENDKQDKIKFEYVMKILVRFILFDMPPYI